MELKEELRIRIATATKDVVLPELPLTDREQQVVGLFEDFYGINQVDVANSGNLCDCYDVSDYFFSVDIAQARDNYSLPDSFEWLYNDYMGYRMGELPVINEVKNRNLLDEYIKFGADYTAKHVHRCHAILVYFPQVTITNEQDKHIDIYKLFVRIKIDSNGRFVEGPKYKRSSYTAMQLKEGYRHSHTPSISYRRMQYAEWGEVCTGRGPINDTIHNLRRNFDEMAWNCFIWELDKIVHIESIAGVPYYKMANLGSRSSHKVDLSTLNAYKVISHRGAFRNTFKDFLAYYLGKKTLKFKYINGQYALGQSLVSYYKDISDNYIEWYNLSKIQGAELPEVEDLYNDHYLQRCLLVDNSIYTENQANETMELQQHVGTPIINFRGTEYKLEIPDLQKMLDVSTKTTLLRYEIMNRVLIQLLNVVNTKYGKETNSSSSEERDNYVSQPLQTRFTAYK